MATSDTEDMQFYDALSNDGSDDNGMVIDDEDKLLQGAQGPHAGGENEHLRDEVRMDNGIPADGQMLPNEVQEDTHMIPDDTMDTENPDTLDLVDSVPGLYRVLDLVHDKGSGGLVDKIIIKQDSLGRLINELCPGAYTSITKVDFSTLDSVRVKPIGLYGSKSTIVEFLLKKKVVSEKTAFALLRATDSSGLTQPYLSSGMYILLREPGAVMYVIYWPEDTTWNDNCPLSVAKNRVTFMRYLTKIADQVVCLMSDEHAKAMVWRGEGPDDDQDSIDDDNSDRLFAFEVSKTNGQEEGVTSRPGFELQTLLLSPNRQATVSLGASALHPRLVRGEMRQGFVTAQYVPEERKLNYVTETLSEARVKNLLQQNGIRLHEDLSAEGLDLLVKLGLRHEAVDALHKYRKDVQGIKQSSHERLNRDLDEAVSRIDNESGPLSASLEETLMARVLLRFPALAQEGPRATDDGQGANKIMLVDDDRIQKICSLYPEVTPMIREAHENGRLKGVTMDKYKNLKDRILTLDHILSSDLGLDTKDMDELVTSTLAEGFSGKLPSGSRGASWLGLSRITGWITGSDSPSVPQTIQIPQDVTDISDEEFLARLPEIANCHPQLSDVATEAVGYALKYFRTVANRHARDLSHDIRKIQRDACAQRIQHCARNDTSRQLKSLHLGILHTLNANLQRNSSRRTVTIQHLEAEATPYRQYGHNGKEYKIVKIEETCTTPQVRYTIYPIEFKEEDAHRMHEDDSYVPAPQTHSHSASRFSLPVDTALVYAHLLPKSGCILVTRDCTGEAGVYVSSTTHISDALSKRPAKQLKHDKIGENLLLAYDESKRTLAVCGMSSAGTEARLELHTFKFDESFTSLQGMGTPVVLSSWYETVVTITHMEFVNSEEIVFVDNDSRARVYSLVAQRFRPATLQLQKKPSSVHSTPDGSCLFVVEEPEDDASSTTLRAYHWSGFGSSEGIKIDIPKTFAGDCVTTSLLTNTNVYLLGLDLPAKTLRSLSFTITSRVTEFTFKRKGKFRATHKEQATRHNALVDCHAEVWTRFPVVPAVRRETVVSALRERRVLAFVSNVDPKSFAPHFSTLIDDFERITRKTTGDELKNIQILALDHTHFLTEGLVIPSTFRAGEWLVELLCLIPIHIAVTRDNRFVPLKDGVWSADLERSLLGADVPKIIDSISFGWYESLFRSYMATKPVKVVSSMGEQSVGKSFALNHLVDTSFAGSAMRTTEGVWMSVTPTDDVLIVALDFEGVHSIERSAQEDTLLVLFNTAISNLVLFRNNFALSRDITGLFQSFQSSASVLDPEANPMLFQSTLAIIIKDVVDSDKDDITKEFYLKFQQIVQAEQAMNFISRLHRNRLDIVPWPVIESRQFYTLFKTIKKRLDQQPVTHQGGAVFLQTMKTLMAKLKANDWGTMSQNMAAHRTHLLLSLLPKALAFGAAEVIPDFEALTNFDTGTVIEAEDGVVRLYLGEDGPQGQPASQDDALWDLCRSWDYHRHRFSYLDADWRQRLQAFLDQTVNARIGHVRAWLHANTEKFGSTLADVQQLFRMFDETVIDIKAGIRLCGTQCVACNLGCILGHRHDGPHSCRTDHRCVHHCMFDGANHGDFEPCGLPAGHPGTHLCDVTTHLCGQTCKLSGKNGCQEACIKPVDHEDEHLCSASTHECGLQCSLSAVRLHGGDIFSCIGRCRIPSDIPHDEHHCDNVQCPIKCQLCKRLCSERDHLHGLNPDAVHLCGEEHLCTALCKAPGICQIEVAPQSVEATFTGRHESFQYTKYTQESRRLQCAVVILAGEICHPGDHTHDLGPKPFHFCEERCPDCGYFCTLPLGHTQKEHDTSHGSMSKTRWAIDGPDGTILEVNGRKFGSNDDGAPMLCSLYCRSLGRHVHIDWCRSSDGSGNDCGGPDHEHILTAIEPEPNRAKDWITHALYWRRTGFKDPYSQEDQINFAKCDSMCNGPEHTDTQPSYCILPILHAPLQALALTVQSPGNAGYISSHGHQFACPNPVVMGQAFHVIFVVDRSTSMRGSDRLPLENTPTTRTIRQTHNNRLGAVFSSLQCFWDARHHPLATNGGAVRRDAYTVILFDDDVARVVSNDFTSSPAELLNTVLAYRPRRGTNFSLAIQAAQQCMEEYWSTERAPVIIFLSDGECRNPDRAMQDVCSRSIALGKPLSFHAVAFGPYSGVLQRMAQIAQEVESRVPQDAVNPRNHVPSAYHEAMDTVRLAETFLGIADSLSKPRGALFRG